MPPAVAPRATPASPPRRRRASWYQRLRTGLSRSSDRLKDNIGAIFTKRRLDAASLEELEEALITADLGVETAGELVAELGRTRFGKEVSDAGGARRARAVGRQDPRRRGAAARARSRPAAARILVCGVNGTGKTTTIGKLAAQLKADGARGGAGGGRHLPRRGDRAARDLGRAHRLPVISRPTGADAAGPRLRRAAAGARRGRRRAADRHRRPAAQQAGADGRARQGGARAQEARCRRAARDPAGARCDHRPERAQPGRDLPRDGAGQRARGDQARRHRARRRGGGAGRGSSACRCARSASARASRICGRSRRAPSPRRCWASKPP